jgi:hypothetical protein
MIANIRDHRTRPLRWRSIKAVIESTSHDNNVADSDQADRGPHAHYVQCEDRDGLSLSDAISWANESLGLVTLYLYDAGSEDRDDDNGISQNTCVTAPKVDGA